MIERTRGIPQGVLVTLAVWLCRLVVIAAVILFMQLAPGRWVSTFAVARPSAIAAVLGASARDHSLYGYLVVTIYEAGIPFLLAAIFGILTAWLLWSAPRVRRRVAAYFTVGYATPRIIFLPLFILWIGVGTATVMLYVAISVYFIFVFNTLEGFDSSGDQLVGVLKVLGLGKVRICVTYLLPVARGYLLAATLIGFPTAVLAVIIAEMLLGGGLGGWIQTEQGYFNVTGLYAATIAATILVGALNMLVERTGSRIQKRLGDHGGGG